MNETMQAILTRRSVRAYKPDMLPRETIDAIIEAGLYAPSGMNTQNTVIIAITDKDTRDRLSRDNAGVMGSDRDPFYGAPVVLVVLAEKGRRTYIHDGALVMGNLMLAASTLGVASCWIHRAKEEFDSPEGKALLKKWGIDERYRGIGHCILGYAASPLAEARPRKEDYIVRI